MPGRAFALVVAVTGCAAAPATPAPPAAQVVNVEGPSTSNSSAANPPAHPPGQGVAPVDDAVEAEETHVPAEGEVVGGEAKLLAPAEEVSILAAVGPSRSVDDADDDASKPPSKGLPRDTIRRAVHRRRTELRACYEKQLKAGEGLAGKLTVKFTIGATGGVVAATVEGGFHAKVDACVRNVVLGLRFPSPIGGGEVVVSYPLVFPPVARAELGMPTVTP